VRDVVTNTSPLLYLHRLGRLDLLASLYGRVIVPTAVLDEMEEGRAHGHDVPSVGDAGWVTVARPRSEDLLRLVTALGPGERAAIALAVERPGALLLLDDRLARKHAAMLAIDLAGTLAVLLRAKESGHLQSVRPLVDRLEALGFRLGERTRHAVLARASES
jgi:predicted nucleic acid-binding protein